MSIIPKLEEQWEWTTTVYIPYIEDMKLVGVRTDRLNRSCFIIRFASRAASRQNHGSCPDTR